MSLSDKWKNLRYRVKGEYHAVCDRCGMKFAGEQLISEWTGHLVCQWCFDDKHPSEDPSDYYVVDDTSIEDSRNEPTVAPDSCAFSGGSAVPGFAVAGCMIPGYRNKWNI